MTEIDPPADEPPAGEPVARSNLFARDIPPEPPVIEHRPDPAPLPPAREPRVVRRGGTPFLFTLLLFMIWVGCLYYAWTTPFPGILGPTFGLTAAQSPDQPKPDHQAQTQAAAQASAQATAQAIAPLHDQLDALAARVDKLEKAPPPQAAPAPAPPAAPEAQAPAPAGPPPASADALNTLDQRVEALSAKIDVLAAHQEAPPPAPPPAPAAPPPDNSVAEAATQAAAQAQAQVTALGSKLDQTDAAQKAALADADAARKTLAETEDQQKATIDTLTERLAKLEQGTGKIESEADQAARAARADALAAALAAGKPLGDIPNAPPALARFAKAAPPTDAALRAEFPQVAAHAREVSRAQPSDQSFWARTLSRLQQTVVVRRGDEVIVGDPAAGTLAHATDEVNRDDLAAAVQTLGTLQGPAAAAVAEWVGQVRSLLDARAALTTMTTAH